MPVDKVMRSPDRLDHSDRMAQLIEHVRGLRASRMNGPFHAPRFTDPPPSPVCQLELAAKSGAQLTLLHARPRVDIIMMDAVSPASDERGTRRMGELDERGGADQEVEEATADWVKFEVVCPHGGARVRAQSELSSGDAPRRTRVILRFAWPRT
jgi:hypothetical protein